jgi:hypothetical protein
MGQLCKGSSLLPRAFGGTSGDDSRQGVSLSGARGYPKGIDAFRPSRIDKKLAENSRRKLVGEIRKGKSDKPYGMDFNV